MKKLVMSAIVSALVVVFLGGLAWARDPCITTGKGYASKSKDAIQTINRLMVSPVPGDERRLAELVSKWLAQGYIFVPKKGTKVYSDIRRRYCDRGEAPNMRPVGSDQRWYVTCNALERCQ